ncbi:MAG: CotH kinase family protein, partial [Verrucomicrobiota bacterium]
PTAHTNFKLEAGGEYLALVRIADEQTIHAFEPTFPATRKGLSCGYAFEGKKILRDKVTFFQTPSPGAINEGPIGLPKVGDTKFSIDRGFFDEPFQVELTSKTDGAKIFYTLDGSLPSETNGALYQNPIEIKTTTVLRIMATKEGHEPTNVDTATYLFPAAVVNQPETPADWPTHYEQSNRGGGFFDRFRRGGGGRSPRIKIDYAMTSPEKLKATAGEVEAALRALPALSIVTDRSHFLDKDTGIFINPQERGKESERPVSIELIDPNGREEGFQTNAGIRIRGGHSRSTFCQKHSFRVYFREVYGAGKLKYPLFGDEGTDLYDDIDLRTAQNYSYHYNDDPLQNTFVREVFSRDSQGALGQPYARSRYYHLYLNGLYWGLYQTQEHAEASYGSQYLGGSKEDYDVVKNPGWGRRDRETVAGVTDGGEEGWQQLWETAAELAAADSEEERHRLYLSLQGQEADGNDHPERPVLLDPDNLIDYMLVIFLTGNFDGPITNFAGNMASNNWFSMWNREAREGFQFFCHDSEHSLGSVPGLAAINRVGPFPAGMQYAQNNPQWIHQQLTAVKAYRDQFRARAEETLLGDGPLSLEANLIRLRHRAQEVRSAILAECARWGDTRVGNPSRGGARPLTEPINPSHWEEAIQRVENVLIERARLVPDQLARAQRFVGGDPRQGVTAAPLFNPSPRPVFAQRADGSGTFQGDHGTVYYTTNGRDPRGPDGKPDLSASKATTDRTEARDVLPEGSSFRALVPEDGSLGLTWTKNGFDDRDWAQGRGGFGYDLRNDYRKMLGVDLGRQLYRKATSAYGRYTFNDAKSEDFPRLTLRLKYEDGFVAYRNGRKVASMNARR